MIVWYKNSILASLVSIISCMIGISGIGLVREGETGSGILMIVVAVAGVLGGKLISDSKAEKKLQKEREAARQQAEAQTRTYTGTGASAASFSDAEHTTSSRGAEEIVNKALEQAQLYALKEDYNTEIHILQNALASVPESAMLLNHLGRAYRRSGDADKAMEYYRRALAVDDSDPTIRGNLGIALLTQGKYQEARPHLESALKMIEARPDSVTQSDRATMHANYALCIGKLGDLTGARENLVKAEQLGYSKDKSNSIWKMLL